MESRSGVPSVLNVCDMVPPCILIAGDTKNRR